MSTISNDYALIANKKGDMLVMQVVHKNTGIIIHTKRCRAINDLHIKSTLRQYRHHLFEGKGLEQILLNDLVARHGVDPDGKTLKEILDEVNSSQNGRGYKPIA